MKWRMLKRFASCDKFPKTSTNTSEWYHMYINFEPNRHSNPFHTVDGSVVSFIFVQMHHSYRQGFSSFLKLELHMLFLWLNRRDLIWWKQCISHSKDGLNILWKIKHLLMMIKCFMFSHRFQKQFVADALNDVYIKLNKGLNRCKELKWSFWLRTLFLDQVECMNRYCMNVPELE